VAVGLIEIAAQAVDRPSVNLTSAICRNVKTQWTSLQKRPKIVSKPRILRGFYIENQPASGLQPVIVTP